MLLAGKCYKPPDQEIEDFLEEFRACSRPRIDVMRTRKTVSFLLKKNLTFKDVDIIIFKDLNSTHYIDGPDEERDTEHEQGEIWEFVVEKFNRKIYIKLKLFKDHLGVLRGKCLQFHD